MIYPQISNHSLMLQFIKTCLLGAPLKSIEFPARPGRPHPVVKIYPTWTSKMSSHVMFLHAVLDASGLESWLMLLKYSWKSPFLFDDSLPNSCWWKKGVIPGSGRPKIIKARTFAGVTSQQRSGNLPQTKIKANMVVKASNAVEKNALTIFNQQKREVTIYKCDLRSPQP